MNSSISYTHSDFLLELSEFSSSKNSRVPKTLVPKVVKFQKLSSSKNSRVPKAIEFHSSDSRVPKVLLSSNKLSSIIQNSVPYYFWFHRIEFHPSELEFQITSEFQRTEFHHSELQFHITSGSIESSSILQNSSSKLLLSSKELSSIIQNFSSNLLLCCIHSSSIFRTRVPKYSRATHTLFGFHNNSSSTELYRVPSSHITE